MKKSTTHNKHQKISIWDNRWFSIAYILICAIFGIAIIIVQEIGKFYDDQYVWYATVTLLVKILVPIFAGLTCLYTLTSKNKKVTWLISIALLACFIAELLGSLGISYNLIAFVVCHIVLSIYFIRIKCFSKNDWKSLIPILVLYGAYVLFCFLWLIPRVELISAHKVDIIFKLAVPIYGALLSFMLWRALCTYGKPQWFLFIMGAVIFYLSDMNVMIEGIIGFGKTDPIGLFTFTWITYPIALTLVSCFSRNTLQFINWTNAI